ncbi:unnamed protein product, partial [Rotaria magnacalcarata]
MINYIIDDIIHMLSLLSSRYYYANGTNRTVKESKEDLDEEHNLLVYRE